MRDHTRWGLLIGSMLMVLVAACGEQESDQGSEAAEPAASEETAAASGNEGDVNQDVAHAQNLWQEIKDYESWPEPDGLEGWQEGNSPHGAVLRYHVNNAARQGLGTDGAVIVKANYSAQSDDALESLTVMEKREGYDPETGNWFYVKYSPRGSVMENPQGMKLAGLVGKDMDTGCIACHARAGGGDHVFMND